MQRACFQLQVNPQLLAEYRDAHAVVWPEMLQAIADSGRRNYSLFLREDGLLIGYFEAESIEDSQAFLAADPRAARWEAAMAGYFATRDGRADQNLVTLPEVFNLEDQLAKEAP
jgi:L-rhamnose mutarotase